MFKILGVILTVLRVSNLILAVFGYCIVILTVFRVYIVILTICRFLRCDSDEFRRAIALKAVT